MTGSPAPEGWVRPIDAAELLGVSSRAVYALVDEGRLQAAADGRGRLVVSATDVESMRVG